ncbi:MAG: M48 family metalloprotease [Gemmatimonadota bacterium]
MPVAVALMTSPPSYRLAALPSLLLALACATNPVTGKSELSLISESQEISMGQQAAQETRQQIGVVADNSLQTYVRGVGLKIAKTTERPNLPWSFDVVDDPAVNAFALPGGFIFITRGILAHMNSEAEMASVLGHEIGHVTAKHSVHSMSQAQLAQLGLGIGSVLSPQVAALSGLAGQGLQLLFLKYSRDNETQADDLGFRYALNDGYDVRAMLSMFSMLQRIGESGGGGKLPQWLATHPDPGDRLAKTEQRLAAATADLSKTTLNADPFMQRINGLVFGENPRQGFFEGVRFNHPDLIFRIDFPQGWQTQNQASAVLAVSPQQDGIFAVTIPGKDAPATMLQQFLAQQGIQAGQSSSSSINGLPAAAADFQAQSQDGSTIAGRVTFVAYNGSTYRLLGYTTAANFGNYRSQFQQAAQSFDRLTDQAALNKQPVHIKLVRLARDMTVDDFNRQYPSAVPVATIALINGAAGPADLLKAGKWAKRVQ